MFPSVSSQIVTTMIHRLPSHKLKTLIVLKLKFFIEVDTLNPDYEVLSSPLLSPSRKKGINLKYEG